jgi:hypothetical protein
LVRLPAHGEDEIIGRLEKDTDFLLIAIGLLQLSAGFGQLPSFSDSARVELEIHTGSETRGPSCTQNAFLDTPVCVATSFINSALSNRRDKISADISPQLKAFSDGINFISATSIGTDPLPGPSTRKDSYPFEIDFTSPSAGVINV